MTNITRLLLTICERSPLLNWFYTCPSSLDNKLLLRVWCSSGPAVFVPALSVSLADSVKTHPHTLYSSSTQLICSDSSHAETEDWVFASSSWLAAWCLSCNEPEVFGHLHMSQSRSTVFHWPSAGKHDCVPPQQCVRSVCRSLQILTDPSGTRQVKCVTSVTLHLKSVFSNTRGCYSLWFPRRQELQSALIHSVYSGS